MNSSHRPHRPQLPDPGAKMLTVVFFCWLIGAAACAGVYFLTH